MSVITNFAANIIGKVLALIFVLLVACCVPKGAGHLSAKYKPLVNPAPHYFMTIKGFVDPQLQKHIHLAFLAEYDTASEAPKCNKSVNELEGVQDPFEIFHAYPVHIESNGVYEVKIPLDYFRPGECQWSLGAIRYRLRNEKDQNTSELVSFWRKGLLKNYGGISYDCGKTGPSSCSASNMFGLANSSESASYKQQITFYLSFYFKKDMP